MLSLRDLMKVPGIEPAILLAVEREHARDRRHRRAAGRRRAPPSVEEPVVPKLFIPLAPAPQRPR